MGVGAKYVVVLLTGVAWAWWGGTRVEDKCDMEDISLEGKVVIVTGASTGIGYQIALEVAKR